jgi:hypothetical protein
MVAGMWVYFQRKGFKAVTLASLIAGFFGGFGFATAALFKLIEVKSGWQTNWHSVLEQTYGFINGLGIAAAMLVLRKHLPPVTDDPPLRRWTDAYAGAFVLVGITWVNLRRNPADWLKAKAVPDTVLGWSAGTWFNLAYLLIATVCLIALFVHSHRPLPLVPRNHAGKAQLLFLVFLWWVVVGNFERAIVSFAPERLVTEGVIQLNAALCSLLALVGPMDPLPAPSSVGFSSSGWIRRVAMGGLVAAILSVAADWVIVRAVWGNQFAGNAKLHIRFGPNATATKDKPSPALPHP